VVIFGEGTDFNRCRPCVGKCDRCVVLPDSADAMAYLASHPQKTKFDESRSRVQTVLASAWDLSWKFAVGASGR
jgi:hypothetical protein